jgi:hypothetical protein
MLTGQRGAAEYSLVDGLVQIQKQNETSRARILELNETVLGPGTSLAQRTSILEAEVEAARDGEPNLLARVTEVDTARVNGDASLASSITTVEANATASGQVRLTATSAPSGYSAQYSWQLQAGNKDIGMFALLDSLGNARIRFRASQFMLEDPSYNGGLPQTVFNYGSGRFAFSVPVYISEADIGSLTVSNAKIQGSAVSQTSVSSGGSPSLSINLRSGAKVIVTAVFTVGTYLSSSGANGNLYVNQGGSTLASTNIGTNTIYSGGSGGSNSTNPLCTVVQAVWEAPSTNNFSFSSNNDWPGTPGSITLTVVELSK